MIWWKLSVTNWKQFNKGIVSWNLKTLNSNRWCMKEDNCNPNRKCSLEKSRNSALSSKRPMLNWKVRGAGITSWRSVWTASPSSNKNAPCLRKWSTLGIGRSSNGSKNTLRVSKEWLIWIRNVTKSQIYRTKSLSCHRKSKGLIMCWNLRKTSMNNSVASSIRLNSPQNSQIPNCANSKINYKCSQKNLKELNRWSVNVKMNWVVSKATCTNLNIKLALERELFASLKKRGSS